MQLLVPGSGQVAVVGWDAEMEPGYGLSTYIYVCKAFWGGRQGKSLEENLHLHPTNIRDRLGGNL